MTPAGDWPRVRISGRFWRMLAPRWSSAPLSGAGAARAGGRWNAPGQAALYLSDSHATAIAEYQQDLPRPGTLTGYDVDASRMLDLADPATRAAMGVEDWLLAEPWKRLRDVERTRPAAWEIAGHAVSAGFDGVRVPSVPWSGRNLVLWHWNDDGGAAVRHIDPLGDLPRDRSSWPP